MARLGVNEETIITIKEDIDKIRNNNKIMESLKNNDNHEIANKIKDYLKQFFEMLQYRTTIENGCLYRVRLIEDDIDYYSEYSELLIPPPGAISLGRLNNKNINVLYTSFHYHTAMMESGVNKLPADRRFQLTYFNINSPLNCYELGTFSKIVFNLPMYSDIQAKSYKDFGFVIGVDDEYIKKLAFLEKYLLDILYAENNKNNYSYVLSSLISEVIFETNNKDRIDAIIYPTQQYRFGTNLAIRSESIEKLSLKYTFANKIYKKHSYDLFKYHTEFEGEMNNEKKIEFKKVKKNYSWY